MIGMGGVVSTWMAIMKGNAEMFRHYISCLAEHFSLPRELFDQRFLDKRMSVGAPFEVQVSGGSEYVRQYDAGIERLGRNLCRSGPLDFGAKQGLFWLIRLSCVACAFCGRLDLTLWVSLLQFVALPYSLFVAVAYGGETVLVLYTANAIVLPLLTYLLHCACPACLELRIAFGPRWLLLFLLVDQLACAVCLWRTPNGKTAPVTAHRVLQSIVFGFLNCKSYYLVLFPLMFGLEIPVAPWLVDAALGLTDRLSDFGIRYGEVFFYHVHRMGHVRHVYPDAHKFHHSLPDCTAFDGHIFGSGAPEEWPILMSDIAFSCCLGMMPGCLSYPALKLSWCNKWSFHTRSALPEGHEHNFHADHHAMHSVNFGMYPPYELLMKTLPPKQSEAVEYKGFRICRVEEGSTVRLQFVPTAGDCSRVPAR